MLGLCNGTTMIHSLRTTTVRALQSGLFHLGTRQGISSSVCLYSLTRRMTRDVVCRADIRIRAVSTASAPSAVDSVRGEGEGSSSNDSNNKKKSSDKNIFLDNLGTIFLTGIGLVIASLVRSFYGSTRKNQLRDKLEEESALDPIEVDDLRYANPRIDVKVFRSLVQDLRGEFPSGKTTYEEFVLSVRKHLQSKHDIPTIELGHLLDRVALQVAKERGTRTDEPQTLTLWLVLLSLALNAPTPDRIRMLFEILESDVDEEGSVAAGRARVTLLKARDLVGYLQSTSQLVVDTQIIPTEGKAYPIQQHHRGTPDELVHWDGDLYDEIDIDALAGILRSKSVCAWGECYSKKKYV